ncbi:hypothetical protein lerEdw1_016290 [Lerista edwardsae]|nr:hypothetical protein lerEdw1_016290 [Lerista edwardsae]
MRKREPHQALQSALAALTELKLMVEEKPSEPPSASNERRGLRMALKVQCSGMRLTSNTKRSQYRKQLFLGFAGVRLEWPWITHPLVLSPGMHPTGIPHPGITSPSGKQEIDHYDRSMKSQSEPKREKEAKKPTIKKPLNAFMLYMKEMRAKVIAECTLKESAAINQILGRRWHALSREEQAKYYELARKERQLHMQLYPGWSARDNYVSTLGL